MGNYKMDIQNCCKQLNMIYSNEFKNLINSLNSIENIEHYIGTGNPSSSVVFFGKELGFDPNKSEQLKREVYDNVSQWKNNINGNFNIQDNYTSYNPLLPYNNPKKKAGHTWSKYQKLSRLIFNDEKPFFQNVFVSEIGVKPSKTSKSQGITEFRSNLIKNSKFFQNFSIVVLACGDYLSSEDIEYLFNVKRKECLSKPYEKLLTFESSGKFVINTRQLSFNVKNTYIDYISTKIKQSNKLIKKHNT